MEPLYYHHELSLQSTSGTDILDITEEVAGKVRDSGFWDGVAVLFVPGSTGALTTIEFESGVLNDLRRAIERMAPRNIEYEHDRRWGDGNGYSHVRAAMMGASLYVPVTAGRPILGTWQQVVLCDFDNRPRRRKIIVQVSGE